MSSRFQEMCMAIQKACTEWENFSRKKTKKNYFSRQELQKLATLASVKIMFHGGSQNRLTYIGSWKDCQKLLKACPEGKVLYRRGSWLWEGNATPRTVLRLLRRENSRVCFLSFYIPQENQHQTALNILRQNFIPRHIIISSDDDKRHFYCGTRKICRRLLKALSGRIYQQENFWCWEGGGSVNQVKKIVDVNYAKS